MPDLEKLRAVPAARARLDAEELELIDRARRDGATWGEIAAALGLGSRQAAEQRRLRLVAAVPPVVVDAYGKAFDTLRQAALELHRRVGADRRWDRRFTRAVLVRETLAAVPAAAGGALFALAEAVIADLAEAAAPLPAPTRAAVDRLRAALEAASPQR
ncbi:hypothetical protein Aab01nite_40190 [Paractinoplanes abujensis]|uniref:Uncharacterized protein n=1 Tax=Paractinoplanes abujensis TaxID=882441 RepID=A0A7W7CWL2_9ACTN|nr:hypothetical protein [Actinoplanes abujensis]MBB4694356.1 hypothetical protein [Actinoplanes abujensis]GID20429.1 hypothetical protein Aab01nite_40190 [Actinoplanes abujensis]